MATLTNNINAQNIVDRFADYVQATANQGISWGTNAYPFGEFPNIFGGDTGGKPIEVNGGSLPRGANDTISADGIYNTLLAETNRYTKIRNLRALLFVDGSGGNTGSRPTPGYVYDATAVAFLNNDYQQSVSSNRGEVLSGNLIRAGDLEFMFDSLRGAYNNARAQTVEYQVNVCHASCHSSCHGSRGRR